MRYLQLFAITLIASPVLADGTWSDREICRAATKTYFFLSEAPADATDAGRYMGYVSAKGNTYTCRVDGNVADFAWINKSGENMRSRTTTFAIAGPRLTVKTDMMTEVFKAE